MFNFRNRHFTVIGALFLCLGCRGAEPSKQLDGEVFARVHFAGAKQISEDAKATNITAIAAMAESVAFRESILDKLSTAPYRTLRRKVANQCTNSFSADVRAMMVDLMQNESYLEVRGMTNDVPEFLLAVHLDKTRAEAWQGSLSNILTNWTALPTKKLSGKNFSGWELKKHHPPNYLVCVVSGDWLMFGCGQDSLKLQPAFLKRIQEQQRPVEALKDIWLDLELDCTAKSVANLFTLPLFNPANTPKLRLTLEGVKGFVRPELVLKFPQPLGIQLKDWQIPTNIIRYPVTSFTAIRGIDGWLKQQPRIESLNLPAIPDQATLWARAGLMFDGTVVFPMADSSNVLVQTQPAIVSNLNATVFAKPAIAQVTWVGNAISLEDFPVIAFYLKAVHLPQSDYLMSGVFPMPVKPLPSNLPTNLLNEVYSKTNLLAYDWENSGDRLYQWHTLSSVFCLLHEKGFPADELPGQKWLTAIDPKLGICATEATLVAPDEIKIVRNSPLALSAFEVNLLAYWFDSPDFPLKAGFAAPERKRRGRPAPMAPPGFGAPMIPSQTPALAVPMPVPPATNPSK